MEAVYVSNNSFYIVGDQTFEFSTDRRLKLDCGVDGFKFAAVVSSSYNDPYTTVIIDEDALTANLIQVWYSIIQPGQFGNLPNHHHTNDEGDGGAIGSVIDSFLDIQDTPATYSGTEGMYLISTGSGIDFTTLSGLGGSWLFFSTPPTDAVLAEVGTLYYDDSTGNLYEKNNNSVPYVPANTLIYDTFSSTALNTDLWDYRLVDNSSVTVNGYLQLNNITGNAHSGATVYSSRYYPSTGISKVSFRWMPNANHYSSAALPCVTFRNAVSYTTSTYYGNTITNCISLVLGITGDDNGRSGLTVTYNNTNTLTSAAMSIAAAAWHDVEFSINWTSGEIVVDLDSSTYTMSTIASAYVLGLIGANYVVEFSTCDYDKNNTEAFDDILLTGDGEVMDFGLITWNLRANFIKKFIDLVDAPSTYSGTDGMCLVSTGSGLDWVSIISDGNLSSSSTIPTDYDGAVGDFVINTTNGTIYEKVAEPEIYTTGKSIAKSVIIDIANNWGDPSYIDGRSVEFFYQNSLIPLVPADFTAYGAFYSDASLHPENLFDTTTSKIGSVTNNAWISNGTSTNTRVICVFDNELTFDKIVVNNGHHSGTTTSRGLKDTKIYVSTDSITDLTYGATISNSVLIFDGQIAQHPATDTIDDQTLTLTDGNYVPSDTWATVLGPSSFIKLIDTPATYSGTEGMFLHSTGSGVEWISASLSGSTFLVGDDEPAPDVGNVGDFYIQQNASKIYKNFSVVEYDYFNEYDTGTLALSNGDRTISCVAATSWGAARSFSGHTSGKYYVEATMNGGTTYLAVGVLGATDNISTGEAYIGSSTLGWGWLAQTSTVRKAGGDVLSMGLSFLAGDIIGMAVDLDNDLLYFSKNGVWVAACGNPNIPTGGINISARGANALHLGLSSGYSTSCVLTMNFGQSTFSYTAPTGYITGWGAISGDLGWGVVLDAPKTFLSLSDTPSTYSGTDGLYAQSTGSGVIWAGVSTTSSFLDLTDTPASYVDTTGMYTISTGSGIEFTELTLSGSSFLDGTVTPGLEASDFYIQHNNGIYKKTPYIDSNIKLLIHSDSYNGSTEFEDSSNFGHQVSYTNQVYHSSAQSKFGGTSIRFEGSTDYITIPASSDFNFAGNPATIDLWFYTTNTNIQQTLINSWTSPTSNVHDWFACIINTNKICMLPIGYYGNMTTNVMTGTTTVTTNVWHHFAFTFDGTTCRLFLDGNLEASANLAFQGGSSHPVIIGTNGSSVAQQSFFGYIDEIRIVNGVADWIDSFSVPTNFYNSSFVWAEILTTNKSFVDLIDAPTSYSGTEGLFLRSTGSGVVWSNVSEIYSGEGAPTLLASENKFYLDTLNEALYNAELASVVSIQAKSVIFDCATNWGNGTYMSIDTIEFKLNGVLITNPDPSAYATSYYDGYYHPKWAFDTDVDKNLSWGNNCSWVTSNNQTTNQRVIVVFDSITEFDEIVINNGHMGATFTDTGAKDVIIYASSDVITDTTYGAVVSNSTTVFDGQFSQHVASDVIDDETLSLIGLVYNYKWFLKIKNKRYFTDLEDTPDTYTTEQYLRTTASGVESIDGIILKAPDESEWRIVVDNSGNLSTVAV